MKKIILLLLWTAIAMQSKSQSVTDSVKTAVNQLFIAMKNSDTVLLKNCFANTSILQTIRFDKTGKLFIEDQTVDAFAKAIGQTPKGSLDERIEFDVVKTDGPLAIVWTPYQFYYEGKFSHCGVNSFQLIRTEGGWKIQYLIDTRKKKDCQQ